MKIHKPKKLGLWYRINLKLLSWSIFIAKNPEGLFYTFTFGLPIFGLLFGWLGYNFYHFAMNGSVGYWFGFGVMCLFELMILRFYVKWKHYKKKFSIVSQDELIDMTFGTIINPIIDKVKKK